MKIDLPLEVWVAIFESLSREQLAALLPHIGDEQEETRNRPIADRQFVRNVQFYLHECGDVTLGWFWIESSSKGPVFVKMAGKELLLAEVPPIPSNIRSFEMITINYYDQSVLDFLQEFRHNSLLINVHLILSDDQMMDQLLPLITSIESLTPICNDHNMFLFQEELSDMMASARILYGCDFGYGSDDCYRHWLHIPTNDGKPRILLANNIKHSVNEIYPVLSFIEEIKKDFLDANQAVSFLACFWAGYNEASTVQSISLTNDKTQEKLVIEGIDIFPQDFVTISRYPMGAKEECIKDEMVEITVDVDWTDCQERIIHVDLDI